MTLVFSDEQMVYSIARLESGSDNIVPLPWSPDNSPHSSTITPVELSADIESTQSTDTTSLPLNSTTQEAGTLLANSATTFQLCSQTSTYVLPNSLVHVLASIPDLPDQFDTNCLLVYDAQPPHVVATQGGIVAKIVPPGTQHFEYVSRTVGVHIYKG